MPKFEIECHHTVKVTYRVEAETEKKAISKLYDIELFCEYAHNTFGPNDYVMDKHGIEFSAEPDCCSDPSPTGHQSVRRDWVVNWLDDDEEEEEA